MASFRHGGERGLGGCGFRLGAEGLEAIEVAGDLANGPLEAVDHASDAVEDGGLAFQGVDAGVPEFGFVVAESIETPGVGRELVDELALDVVEGSPGFLEFGGESIEFGGIFAGDDEGLGAWIPYLTGSGERLLCPRAWQARASAAHFCGSFRSGLVKTFGLGVSVVHRQLNSNWGGGWSLKFRMRKSFIL